MGRELCRQCGRELPNDTGTYCPICGEPRKEREKSTRPEEDPRDRIERILAGVGELSLQARMPNERKALSAFEAVDGRCKGLSVWRTRSREGDTWFVIVLGELQNRTEFEKARMLVKRKGGVAVDRDVEMIEALRERRRHQTLSALMKGTRGDVVFRTHFGRSGARLHPDGTMGPDKRPQG